MILNNKITVKNYKCFDSTGGGFDRIMPINLIIGKNNSGKSSLLDLVSFIIEQDKEFIEVGRDNLNAEVLVERVLTEENVVETFNQVPGGTAGRSRHHFEYMARFVGKAYTYKLDPKGKKTIVSIEPEFMKHMEQYLDMLARVSPDPFSEKIYCHISAERDIVPEIPPTVYTLAPNIALSSDGSGATKVIHEILSHAKRDSDLIEKALLGGLNTIVNPDIKFTRILVQLIDHEYWEIFFVDAHGKQIALSKMGSGVKTVLLVLLNLTVRPIIENKDKSSYVFAFEELENNLHPALQRRLYNYIRNYSKSNSAYFFLTTHSNVVIDAFGMDENAQLIHVINDGDKSTSTTIQAYRETEHILNDLGIKASDILQSNGVIWVEGPSDRNYINKWLEILAPDLQEGLHYSVMFYGGRLLSNLSFDFDRFNKEVIPLLKINRNAFVVLDRDGRTLNTKINDTKQRITTEIGENNYWITRGREIENYLSDETVSKWLSEKYVCKSEFTNDSDSKFEYSIDKINQKVKYNLNKTALSSEIAKYIDVASMETLDLKKNIENLIVQIKKWNCIDLN
ncbi:MAG: AAA family ATPase [Bacteroidales bacterium]|nr:AAA family ATPase [Bacteroidales bacterium]